MGEVNGILDKEKIYILESMGYLEVDLDGEEKGTVYTKDFTFAESIFIFRREYDSNLYFWRKELDKYYIYFAASSYDDSGIEIGKVCYISIKNEDKLRNISFINEFPHAGTFESFVKKVETYFSYVSEVYEFMMEYKDEKYTFKNYDFMHIFSRGILFSIDVYMIFIESDILPPFDTSANPIDLYSYAHERVKDVFQNFITDIEKDSDNIVNNILIVYSKEDIGEFSKTIDGIRKSIENNGDFQDCHGEKIDIEIVRKIPDALHGRFRFIIGIRWKSGRPTYCETIDCGRVEDYQRFL